MSDTVNVLFLACTCMFGGIGFFNMQVSVDPFCLCQFFTIGDVLDLEDTVFRQKR